MFIIAVAIKAHNIKLTLYRIYSKINNWMKHTEKEIRNVRLSGILCFQPNTCIV